MYLTLKVKLNPDREQRAKLLTTMKKFNEACNYASEAAWHNKKFGKTGIQKLTYYDIRQEFGLSAQLTVRAIAKVAESYSNDRKTIHKFDRRGAVVYDQRVLSFKEMILCPYLLWMVVKKPVYLTVITDLLT